MRNAILTIIFSALIPMTASANDVERFVAEQMQRYPQLRLLDLYKSCFQDYMGAEHLVTDYESVKRYLDDELKDVQGNFQPQINSPSVETSKKPSVIKMPRRRLYKPSYYEPCGVDGKHVRINLSAITDGYITKETLLDAFMRSANAKHPKVKKWKKRWYKIIKTIDRMNVSLPHYEEDKLYIDSVLSIGKYAISHSDDYRTAYHPHYRIVSKKIFEEELKPLLYYKEAQSPDFEMYSPSTLIIMYDKDVGKEKLLEAVKKYKAELIYDYRIISGIAIKKPDDKTIEETMDFFRGVEGVLSVQRDRVMQLHDRQGVS